MLSKLTTRFGAVSLIVASLIVSVEVSVVDDHGPARANHSFCC